MKRLLTRATLAVKKIPGLNSAEIYCNIPTGTVWLETTKYKPERLGNLREWLPTTYSGDPTTHPLVFAALMAKLHIKNG